MTLRMIVVWANQGGVSEVEVVPIPETTDEINEYLQQHFEEQGHSESDIPVLALTIGEAYGLATHLKDAISSTLSSVEPQEKSK